MDIALTNAQREMLEMLAQLPNHFWTTEVKDEVKALDDLCTLRLARYKDKMYRITTYGLSELDEMRNNP
jgi:hypothetical protein